MATRQVLTLLGALLLGCSCQPPVVPPDAAPPVPTVPVVDASPPEAGPPSEADSASPVPTCQWAESRQSRAGQADRIVGGSETPTGAYPWVCSLQTSSGWHYCGGSLIASDVVLTAAHCQVVPGDVAVCGRSDLGNPRAGVERSVRLVRNHPAWLSTASGFDVALLLLTASTGLEPITMGQDGPGPALALGWGTTSEGGSTVKRLRAGQVEVESCAPYGASIDATMFCAGAPGVDSCQGDSGGPLLQGEAVVGITSWGIGCARPGLPGVYTSVASVSEWIRVCLW
jgi:trypsin